MADKQIVVQAFKNYYRENSNLKLDISKIDNRYIKFSDRHEDKTFLGIAKQPNYENVLSNLYAFYYDVEEELVEID